MDDNDNLSEGRARWKLEEDFVNNRLSWLGVTQSLLFTAYGISITSATCQSPKIYLLICLVPIIGLLTSVFIFMGVIGAIIAMHRLKNEYGLSTYFVSYISTMLGWTCNIGIPFVFVISWLIIITGFRII